jgi:TonB family protein
MISAALGNVLAWSLQAAVVVGAASVLPWLLRLDAAGVRYGYWRVVALLCLVLPWIQPYQGFQPGVRAAVVNVVDGVAGAGSSAADTIPNIDWTAVAVATLATGIVLRFLWLGFGLVKLRRLRLSTAMGPTVAVDADLQPNLGTLADIRYAAHLDQPVTFGVRRPVVLLPEILRTQSQDIQRAVIGHELLHVQRRDWAWLIVEEIAVCFFWFHPAAWWLASRIQLAREEVVDELAILLTGRRKAYMEALLAFADTTSVLPTAAFARRRHLFRRIALVSKEDVMSSRQIVASCAAMALIVSAGSWYAVSAFPLHATSQSGSERQAGPGPLERSAKAVTPENPIPRRIHYEAPLLPNTVEATGGTLVVKLTLDSVGRVAEARVIDSAIKGPGFDVSFSGDRAGDQVQASLGVEAGLNNLTDREALNTFTDAALVSVRQWRYDPPVEAPLTFDVPVRIGKAPEIMAFKAAGPASKDTIVRTDDTALRVGGNIKAPAKIRDVRPAYPPIARAANVTGVVILEVRIGPDGHVEDAHVLRSIPLLDEAALQAVQQWEFSPTLMNGQAVPIIMTVTVNFTTQ